LYKIKKGRYNMTVATDKKAVAEFIVKSTTTKISLGKDACVGDTVTAASNVAGAILFNGTDSESTETERAVVILIGETAPGSDYAGAAPGSIFIQTGASTGKLWVKTDATTWADTTD
jgi:hypothetical protein